MLISLSLFVTSKRGCQHIQCEHFDLFYDSPLSQFTWLVCGYVCVRVFVCMCVCSPHACVCSWLWQCVALPRTFVSSILLLHCVNFIWFAAGWLEASTNMDEKSVRFVAKKEKNTANKGKVLRIVWLCVCVTVCACLICLLAYCCIVYLFSRAFWYFSVAFTKSWQRCAQLACVCVRACVCVVSRSSGQAKAKNKMEMKMRMWMKTRMCRRMRMKMRWKTPGQRQCVSLAKRRCVCVLGAWPIIKGIKS